MAEDEEGAVARAVGFRLSGAEGREALVSPTSVTKEEGRMRDLGRWKERRPRRGRTMHEPKMSANRGSHAVDADIFPQFLGQRTEDVA